MIQLGRSPDAPVRLIGVANDSFYICGCTELGEAASRFKYIFDGGGARNHYPVRGAYVAEIGFDGIERRRYANLITHSVQDGIAVFRHPGRRVGAQAIDLESGVTLWTYPQDPIVVSHSYVLAGEALQHDTATRRQLVLHPLASSAATLTFMAGTVVAAQHDDKQLVVLEAEAVSAYSLGSGHRLWRTMLADDVPDPLLGRHCAIGDGCFWFPSTEGNLVGVDLPTGKLVSRHELELDRYGLIDSAAHAQWGAVFAQDVRLIQPYRTKLEQRAIVSKASAGWGQLQSNRTQLLRMSSRHHGELLLGPSSAALACELALSPERILLGPAHVVVQWANSRFAVVALSALAAACREDAAAALQAMAQRQLRPRRADDPWYVVTAAATAHKASLELNELANALMEAGLIMLDDSSRDWVLAQAAAVSDEPLALLQEAGCPPAFFLDCIGDFVDAVDSVNSGLVDEPIGFMVDTYTRGGLTLGIVPQRKTELGLGDSADGDETKGMLAFSADAQIEAVTARMNQALVEAGAQKRIYQLFHSESAAFAVLTPAAAKRLDDAGIKLGQPSSWP